MDGYLLASGSFNGSITLWDTNKGSIVRALSWDAKVPHDRPRLYASFDINPPVESVAFFSSISGSTVASGRFRTGKIELWDANTGNLKCTIQASADCINSVAFSPCG